MGRRRVLARIEPTLAGLLATFAAKPTGTPDGSKFYRDDGTWAAPEGGVDPALYADGHEAFSREHISSLGLNHSQGNLRLTYWRALKSSSFTNIEIPTGTTPSSGAAPTLCQGAVFSVAENGELTRLASTTHDATLFGTASADTIKALDATVEIVEGQWYANATLVVTTGTAPTAQGQNPGSAGVAGRSPRLAGVITSQTAIASSYTAGQVADNANRVWTALLP